MAAATLDEIHSIRHFNRFYTQKIRVVNRRLLDSEFSLTEARLLYEISESPNLSAKALAATLGIDPGYLSRTLSRFERDGLIGRVAAPDDNRRRILSLTPQGKRAVRLLTKRSNNQVEVMVGALSGEDRRRLLGAMRTIESILSVNDSESTLCVIRQHGPGDVGYVIDRHGGQFAEEYKFNELFETYITQIMFKFIRNYDPQKERLWIAEVDGERAGSIAITRHKETVAQIRVFLLEPSTRGKGIGKALLDEALDFARTRGYRKIVLQTYNVLTAARHLYKKAGFELVKEEPHDGWGRTLVDEEWVLKL